MQPPPNETDRRDVGPRNAGRRRVRIGCISLMMVLWAGVFVLAAELYLRAAGSSASAWQSVDARVQAVRAEDLQIIEETAPDAPKPPPQVNTHYPNRAALEATPVAEWDALAALWNAILLGCDTEGRILRRHLPSGPPELLRLGEKAATSTTLLELIGETNSVDLQGALAQALGQEEVRDTGYLAPFDLYSRGYSIAVAPGEDLFYKFHFHRMPSEAEVAVAVAVVPSRFARGVYRPYAYQDDLYPAYLKSEFWSNGLGYRDEEVVLPKPADWFRIVCVGGSTTGEGPRNDLTYPNLLEALLRKRYHTDKIDVINIGIDGGIIGGTAALMKDFNKLAPDLYIHYNFPNDVGYVMETALQEGPLSSPFRAALLRVLGQSCILTRHARWSLPGVLLKVEGYERAVRKLMLPHLQTMADDARAAGAQLAICSVAYPRIDGRPVAERAFIRGKFAIPLPVHVELEDFYLAVDAFNNVVRAFCREEGLLYIPTAEMIDGGAELYPDLCHLYIPGLRRKAEIVADAIAPLLNAQDRRESGAAAP